MKHPGDYNLIKRCVDSNVYQHEFMRIGFDDKCPEG